MLVLSREVSLGVCGCPTAVVVFVGWGQTVVVERLLLAGEKSAEVVVPAGLFVVGKDRTRSRA